MTKDYVFGITASNGWTSKQGFEDRSPGPKVEIEGWTDTQ
jgi:hypothetical protein